MGVFKTDDKKYLANDFSGSFEIVSLTGTINTMDGAFYCHLHMSAGNDKGEDVYKRQVFVYYRRRRVENTY